MKERDVSPGKSILIIESEPVFATSLELILQRYGYVVLTAMSGEDGVSTIEKQSSIDLVLLDVDLGEGRSGIALAETILRTRDIPVLFLTSDAERKTVEQAEQVSVYGYIVKNSDETILIASIHMAFKLHEANLHIQEQARFIADSDERLRAAFLNIEQQNDTIVQSQQAIEGHKKALRHSRHVLELHSRIAFLFLTESDVTVYGKVLELVLEEMHSRFGVFGYLDDRGDLIAPSLTNDIWDMCRMSEKSIVFPRQQWGNSIWGRTLREGQTRFKNQAMPTPEGHVAIERALCVPIHHGTDVIGMLHVANKEDEYCLEDAENLEHIAAFISPLLHAMLRRQRIEQELGESEASFRALFERAQSGIATCELLVDEGKEPVDYRILSVNPSFESMMELPRKDILGKRASTIQWGRETMALMAIWRRVVFGGESQTMEHYFSSSRRTFLVDAFPLGKNRFATVFQDISEQKKDHETLMQQEYFYRILFEKNPAVMLMIDPVEETIVGANPAAFAFYGWTEQQLAGKKIRDIECSTQIDPEIHPADVVSTENRRFFGVHRLGNGEMRDVEVFSSALPIIRENVQLWIIHDMTEHKRAERELSLHRGRLLSIVEILQYRTSDIKDFLDFVLDEAIKLTGSKIGYICYYDSVKRELRLNSWSKEVMSECSIAEPQTVFDLEKTGIWGEVIRQDKPILLNDFQAAHPLKKGYPTGHVELYRYMSIPIKFQNEIVAVIAVANKDDEYNEFDLVQLQVLMESVWKIVDQKKTELRIKELDSRYRSLVENSLIGIGIFKENQILFANQAFLHIAGYDTLVEFQARTFPEYLTEESRLRYHGYIDNDGSSKPHCAEIELILIRRDGRKRSIRLNTNTITMENNRYLQISCIDITEQLQYEQRLKRINEGLVGLGTDHQENIAMLTSLCGELLDVSSAMYCRYVDGILQCVDVWGMTEHPDTPVDSREAALAPFFASDDHNIVIIRNLQLEQSAIPEALFMTHRLKTIMGKVTSSAGKKFGVLFAGYDLDTEPTIEDQRILGIISAAIEAEEDRREAENDMRKSLDEKQSLLRELQHRIKNNLLMISTLIKFETDNHVDVPVKDALTTIQGRVNTLSNLYTMLYAVENTKIVRLDTYISNICRSVLDVYSTLRQQLQLEFELEEISLDAQKATPLGLICNELLTNALKHAFLESEPGKIIIRLEKLANLITFSVHDNGQGLPSEEAKQHNKGFGLKLVSMLSRQLRGTFDVRTNGGACFCISFPAQPNAHRTVRRNRDVVI